MTHPPEYANTAEEEISAERFRSVFGGVPTSVAVVSGLDAWGNPIGLAVGTLASVSLDPLLISFCSGLNSSSWPKIRPSGNFCVNVLALGQEEVCAVFASKAADKFDRVPWKPSPFGLPMIEGTVATIDCVMTDEHDAGDHTIVVGRVVSMSSRPSVPPLVFLGGRFGEFR